MKQKKINFSRLSSGKVCLGYLLLLPVWSMLFGFQGRVLAENIPVVEIDTQAQDLLKQGIEYYEQQAYGMAKDVWRQAISLYLQESDSLETALALNNLALAHQQLGEWNLASKAIADSLNLLENPALTTKPSYWEISAKAQNTLGNQQFHQGKVESALETWSIASEYYHRSNNTSGMAIAQINQAKAWQSMGFTLKASRILRQLEQNLAPLPPELQATILKNLGITWRNLGDLAQSRTVLDRSLKLAPKQHLGSILLELGNTQRKQGYVAGEQGKIAQSQEYWQQARQSYQQAEQYPSSATSARLNRLSLLVALGEREKARKLADNWQSEGHFFQKRSNIYKRLNYARSLTCLYTTKTTPICSQAIAKTQPPNNQKFPPQRIITLIQQAIAQAQNLQDPIAEAQGLAQLATVYELAGANQQAFAINQQALLLLEGKSVPDLVYGLEWQLGRIYRQQNELEKASLAYRQSIDSLAQVRNNILTSDPQVQFGFRENIEPVYREYTDLLLTVSEGEVPSQANLKQAVRAIDALQVAELENFLGCNLPTSISLEKITVDPRAAQIYPIILGDRLVTILNLPDRPLEFRSIEVGRSQVETVIKDLQTNLTQPGNTPEVLASAQQLYQWLIAPLETTLQTNSAIETLVFVPDGLLRNISWGVLYDGQQYLIEKDYALVISPQLELFAPATSPKPLKVLTGGVDIAQTIEGIDFSAITQVERELNQIATQVKTSPPLLNQDFTQAEIQQQLQQGDFSAIHWKTHGVFSSDPAATFLVAYRDSIKAIELQSLVQTASQGGQKPLELLVLSACETAKGDNRAILGLAGLTVRTGARTALSTLWRADDRATTLLMSRFYQQLTAGTTKAEALRQAQLALIEEEGYFAPYYWGTYTLVGNWL